VIGLDTNVLARYCVEDSTDLQAARQRLAAGRLIESGQAPMVCKTVVLELDFARLAGKLGLLPGVGLPRRRARNRCDESPTHPASEKARPDSPRQLHHHLQPRLRVADAQRAAVGLRHQAA
jgi:hypothetical protein